MQNKHERELMLNALDKEGQKVGSVENQHCTDQVGCTVQC